MCMSQGTNKISMFDCLIKKQADHLPTAYHGQLAFPNLGDKKKKKRIYSLQWIEQRVSGLMGSPDTVEG